MVHSFGQNGTISSASFIVEQDLPVRTARFSLLRTLNKSRMERFPQHCSLNKVRRAQFSPVPLPRTSKKANIAARFPSLRTSMISRSQPVIAGWMYRKPDPAAITATSVKDTRNSNLRKPPTGSARCLQGKKWTRSSRLAGFS